MATLSYRPASDFPKDSSWGWLAHMGTLEVGDNVEPWDEEG